MVKRKGVVTLGVALSFLLMGCFQNSASDVKPPRMTKEELKSMLGQRDVIVLDVRVESEWKNSDSKIKGAVRENPEKDIKSWAAKYPKDTTLVFYCS